MPINKVPVDPEGDAIGTFWVQPRLSRSVRLTITIDEALLARVDQAAIARGATRSGLIAEGLRQLIDA